MLQEIRIDIDLQVFVRKTGPSLWVVLPRGHRGLPGAWLFQHESLSPPSLQHPLARPSCLCHTTPENGSFHPTLSWRSSARHPRKRHGRQSRVWGHWPRPGHCPTAQAAQQDPAPTRPPPSTASGKSLAWAAGETHADLHTLTPQPHADADREAPTE